MPFGDFDVILGMDELTENNVILDCCQKKFSISSCEGEIIEVKGMRSSDSTCITSSI